MPSKHCFFCDTLLGENKHATAQDICGYFYNCTLCGKYILATEAEDLFLDKFSGKRHLVAGYLHSKIDKEKTTPIITEKNCASFFDNEVVPKNAMEKLENILIYFFKQNDSVGERYIFGSYSGKPTAFFANSSRELAAMFNELCKMGFMESKRQFIDENGFINANEFWLTTQGLMRAAEISSSKALNKKVFIAMGFKEDLLNAKDEAIKPACSICGFDADIVTKYHNEDITYKIISEIKNSRFVVCNLTYNNHGAYYEAGFARGLGLPVIFCCKRDWFDEVDGNGVRINKLHFDVEHINTIFWETHDGLREELVDRIRATIL